MKVLIIGTTIYQLPPSGYSGIEQLCYDLAVGLHRKGHQVTIVAPEGSQIPVGIELIPCAVNEDEEKIWHRYRERLERDEWNVVLDSSWVRWSMMSSAGRDPQLPIVNWHHTDPSVYSTVAPGVRYNMWVGISKNHAERLARHFQTPVQFVYNGIDLERYTINGMPRGERYLWLSRWTVEKGGADMIALAKRIKVGVDMYGDTNIIGDTRYKDYCFREADGLFARAYPGVSRDATVELLSTHKGYLYWLNWDEPFGLSIVEAMATGCPPIVTRRGAVAELIRDGVTGFLADSIGEMEGLIKKDAVKEINVEAMRRHVEENFGLEQFVNRWEELLTKVANGERW